MLLKPSARIWASSASMLSDSLFQKLHTQSSE